jgi:hypothetical protein
MKRWAVALLVLPVLLAGCSASVSVGGTTTVHQSDAVAVAQQFVDQQLRDLPPTRSVDCPNDVEAKVGTDFQCTATLANGQKVTLALRVDQLHGDQAHLISNPDLVNQALAVDVVYKNATASPPKTVDCPSTVAASAGKTFECTATFSGGEVDRATLKVESDTAQGVQDLRVVGVRKVG